MLELTSNTDEIKHKYNGSKVAYLINKMLKMSDKAFTIKLSDRFNNIADAFTDYGSLYTSTMSRLNIKPEMSKKIIRKKKIKKIFTDI